MPEITLNAALKRIRRKVAREPHSRFGMVRFCTSTPRERPNVGRWHIVDSTNLIREWWSNVEELTSYGRDIGALHITETIAE